MAGEKAATEAIPAIAKIVDKLRQDGRLLEWGIVLKGEVGFCANFSQDKKVFDRYWAKMVLTNKVDYDLRMTL